ncbi:ATP-binding protein [Paenibacillus lautus]|uniref:sensor histidine kinase n=1 Tax=Paenibacillus lautus TaxID=1401 RepID=UPI002DBDD5F2|nr:ATP-binding protein [Paenibacillus lautus]MEC0206490.1 ATP-binding protein [Paenibacillus lautus]
MSVGRKIFIVMSSFIIGFSTVFVLLTYIVIRDSMDVILQTSRKEELNQLQDKLLSYYVKNGHTFNAIQDKAWLAASPRAADRQESMLLVSREQTILLHEGDAVEKQVKRLGVKRTLYFEGEPIADMYYYDTDVANLTKLRIGTPTSIIILLGGGTVLFVLLSLGAAYWVSRRLTAPLRKLVPAIERLGQGEYGVQAPVTSEDEYGRVAVAFNGMSSRLEQSETVRRNLVADVAHELRTPLTIVRGKLDLLQQSRQPIQPEHLLPIQDELIRLTRLVGDLHQLSLAEAKQLPLVRKPTDMLDLLGQIQERIEPDADAKNLTLRLTSATERTSVSVDPSRITQVFLNLFINAVRYTPQDGLVRITLQEEPASGMLRIDIRDTGPGIEEEHLPYLFDRFYRTDEARARHQGGMGLGLAIAKEFIVSHGGTIQAESQQGHGTTFTVRLPYHDSDQQPHGI